MSETIRIERDGAVATVLLNRPQKHNALTADVFTGLGDALDEVAGDASVRVVVLAGEGPSFCSGLDLDAGLNGDRAGDVETPLAFMRVVVGIPLRMREMPQPIISAVQGHAVGAGFALATASDLRIAAPDVSFNSVFTSIGMTPGDLGLSWFLPRIIGLTDASDVFYRSRVIGADEAMRLRLVNEVVANPRARATEMAHEIAAMSPIAIRQTKELINATIQVAGFRQHLELEMRTQVLCSMSEQHASARAAFRERR
jgi:enoyl-CoA hydratase